MRRYKLKRRRKLKKNKTKTYKRNQKGEFFGFDYLLDPFRKQKGGFFGFKYLTDALLGKKPKVNKAIKSVNSYLGI